MNAIEAARWGSDRSDVHREVDEAVSELQRQPREREVLDALVAGPARNKIS